MRKEREREYTRAEYVSATCGADRIVYVCVTESRCSSITFHLCMTVRGDGAGSFFFYVFEIVIGVSFWRLESLPKSSSYIRIYNSVGEKRFFFLFFLFLIIIWYTDVWL